MTKLEMLALSQPLSDLYTGLETDLLANIAEFLAAGTLDLPSSQWKLKMLAQLGALDKLNMQTIAAYAALMPDVLTDTLETAALDAIGEMEPGFAALARDGIVKQTEVPIERSMAAALQTYQKQARQSLNMVNTVMKYKARAAAQTAIKDAAELSDKQEFLDMLNKAAGKAVTGIESRQAAMRQCIREMSEKGIPAFVDKRGREWSPEAYVNMDIRTTVANVAHQAQFQRMDDYGLNLVEVSSHSGARPKCARDQGKIFNRSGGSGTTTDLRGREIRYYAWSDSSYGEPDGLLGINCGHQIYPFMPGVSLQTYFPIDEEENAKEYARRQQQRELERRVRKVRRECMMLETAGDKEGLKKAKAKLNTRVQTLRTYCDDNGLKYKPDRTAVVNYKKSMAGFVPADKRKKIAEIQRKGLDISGGSGIINKKVSDRIINLFNESDNMLFDFEEIETELLNSSVGRDIAEFIEFGNFTINMNYDLDTLPSMMGDVLGNDITVYAVNHNSLQEVAETVIHEVAHKKYSWDKDQEGEVNCRLLEHFHAHEEITDEQISEIVGFVRREYGDLPEGDLYGY